MKHIPYLCNSREEFVTKVGEFRNILQTMPEYTCILATVYVDAHLKREVPILVKVLKEQIPDVQIIGGTVSANISAGVINLSGIALTFVVFFKGTVDIFSLDWDKGNSSQMGKDLLWQVRQMYQPVAMQIISSGYNLDIDPFLKEMSNIPEDIAVFGGILDDGTVSGQGFVFTDSVRIERGLIVVVYKGRNLFVHLDSCSGWQPLGRMMRITGLADNDTTITQIDNKFTVKDIYKRYLGVNWDDSFFDEVVIFPLCVDRGGTIVNRMPRMFGKEPGSTNCGGSFRLGDNVQLCYGNPAEVIQETYALQHEMLRFEPEGLFAISCWSRKVLLNQDINQELKICRSEMPVTGCYVFGEFIRNDRGRIYLNNMYFSILGMREGGIEEEEIFSMSRHAPKVKFQNRGNSVVSHMMHFVQAVSSELEEYNNKLQIIANTDKLTGLYNRTAIDRILADEIKETRASIQPLTVFFVDMDNFKSINDTYGHLIGDAALMQVAGVLRKNLHDIGYAGRWGGDEFIAIVPKMDADEAYKVAETIRCEVNSINAGTENMRMTVSIGLAEARALEDAKSLFKRMDDALYEAKYQKHKNNVTVAR